MEAADRFDAAFRASIAVLREQSASERARKWWVQYDAYLDSEEWKARSMTTIRAAGGVCSYCVSRPAVQAHHVTYDRVGNELPEDLRAVCLACHHRIHAPQQHAAFGLTLDE